MRSETAKPLPDSRNRRQNLDLLLHADIKLQLQSPQNKAQPLHIRKHHGKSDWTSTANWWLFWLWGHCSSWFCSSRGTVNKHYYGEVSHWWEQMHHKPPAQRQKQNWFHLLWKVVGTHGIFRAVIFGCLEEPDCSPSLLIHLIWHPVISFSFCG